MIEHLDALSGSPSLFSAWKHHAPSSPPLLCLPAGILVIEHLDALSLSLERLDQSRNRLTLAPAPSCPPTCLSSACRYTGD